MERLQKILAGAGIASRRRAEEFIRQGRVKVDGRVVTEMGAQVDPDRQLVEFDGKPITTRERPVYILLHKPRGYVSTVHDPQGRPVVTSLLKEVRERVFPVGRLDLDSEGALLLTNDGELANRILHPRFEIKKTYHARVVGRPEGEQLRRLAAGIVIEGQRTWPAAIRILESDSESSLIEVIIHEGRKRQVRKMFAAIGHPVRQLKRIAYGGLGLGNLPPGRYRFLTGRDLALIWSAPPDRKRPRA
ncbi:MAG TPA: pseudouridine synthase [Candidatus Sulfotelmatobacter sp.]|nr:pseudouridine synthase [Candidatus Sulfotelmatobacter sp.]